MAVYKSKNPTKDGRIYFFRIKYRDILGVSHDYTSPKYKTQKEAVNEEALYRINIGAKKSITSNITIGQAFEEYFAKHSQKVKKQTALKILNLYEHIKKFKNIKINDITLNIVNAIKKELADNKTLGTIRKNRILGLLKICIKYANKYYNSSAECLKFFDNFVDVNSQKKEMDFFTYEEYQKFDSVIDKHNWHTFFEILYFMGLRQGECQALTWQDINFEKKMISITKTLTSKIKGVNWTISAPKTKNSTRILPMPNNVLNDLKSIKNEVSQLTDYSNEWFVFGNSIPFKETTIANYKNNYCQLAKVKQIRVHDFRHSCASFLISQGASITLVSKYLGHSKVSITLDIYSHFYKSELENIVERINNL